MARAAEDAPILTVRRRAELRDWREQHHGDGRPVWLASFKKPHPDDMPHEVPVEELPCWGRIESVTRALDADCSMILIAPRRVTSAWSAINKRHVDRASASGAMTPAGEAKIATAMANGQWAFLDEVERLDLPPDLAAALESGGRAVWDASPRSVKRGCLDWIKTAKTAPTGAARRGLPKWPGMPPQVCVPGCSGAEARSMRS
jgi:uncharacterized protein YdeI (YjbR/CyaY-like superfamily)